MRLMIILTSIGMLLLRTLAGTVYIRKDLKMNMPSEQVKILVADNDKNFRGIIQMSLEAEGFLVRTAGNFESALHLAMEIPFDLALLDLKLAQECGITLMEKIHAIHPEMPIIILTAHGSIDSAVEAMQKGACSYIQKPFEQRNLLSQIQQCIDRSNFYSKIKTAPLLKGKIDGLDKVIGKSARMKQILDQVIRAAASDSSVYIEGESGTGKEMIAGIVHAASPRKDNPFVVVNCGAIPETLFESEFFGFEKGAFTGADIRKEGFFAQAHGGSFFLDEITEIPLSLQTKLLRVVQEGEFFPLGGRKIVTVDTRLISTSNRNIESEVKNGNFREDLFYRIHVISIKLPPLRERREDIPLLARFFLEKYSALNDRRIIGFTNDAMEKMVQYDWPGNIREMKNEIESAVVLTEKEVVSEADILRNKHPHIRRLLPYKEAKADFEKRYISRLMNFTQGNMTRAACLSGKYRADLYQFIKKYGLDPSEYRQDKT